MNEHTNLNEKMDAIGWCIGDEARVEKLFDWAQEATNMIILLLDRVDKLTEALDNYTRKGN